MTSSSDLESPMFHPLMDRIQRPMSRRAMLAGASGVIATRMTGMSATAQTPVASPEIQIEGETDAVELLNRSAETLAGFETFAFEMETVQGSSTVMQGFELKSVTGVVRRPLDLQAEVEVGTPLGSLSIGAVSLDGIFYVQDPLSDGAWMEIGQVGELQTVINPDVLILLAVRLVQDARITGTENVDGSPTTVVEGTVDFSGLLDDAGQAESEAAAFLSDEPVDVMFWIDDEDRILEVEMLGPILASESDDVVRVISLFEFNEPVEIEAPVEVTTPGQ
jgi:hypothetical protein